MARTCDLACWESAVFFFALSSVLLAVVLLTLIVGAAGCGLLLGRSLREKRESVSESFGVLQAALLGFMGLILAFGLSLAIGRYDTRRQAVVDDANAIGTTYLRAQTLAEPVRSRSLALLVRYTDVELRLSHVVPGTTAASRTVAQGSALQRQLWSLAAQAVQQQPVATAPRLYEDSLNAMIDEQTVRVAGLSNRVPTEVLLLEIIGAAIALGLLGLHVGVLGRGMVAVLLAAAMVSLLLYVTFDLDRPTRGLIQVPDTSLAQLRASMNLPPAAGIHP
jgi:hypothetical protein